MARPADLSTLLPGMFVANPLGTRLRETGIWRVWAKAVGQSIAGKAQPVAFRDGVLTVIVSSAPWMQQLGFLKRQLIDSVNRELGEDLVREIYLKAGRISPPAPPQKPTPRAVRPLTPEERSRIERDAATIPDDELRAAVISCHATWLSTTKPET